MFLGIFLSYYIPFEHLYTFTYFIVSLSQSFSLSFTCVSIVCLYLSFLIRLHFATCLYLSLSLFTRFFNIILIAFPVKTDRPSFGLNFNVLQLTKYLHSKGSSLSQMSFSLINISSNARFELESSDN